MSSSRWQCSKCWRIYTFEQFMALPSVWIDEKRKGAGKEPVCECGARFHTERWYIETLVDSRYLIHTVHLQLAHPEGESKINWFETMILDKEAKSTLEGSRGRQGNWLPFQVRYETLEQAKVGHAFAVKNINRILEEPDKHPQDILSQFLREYNWAEAIRDKEEKMK